MYTIDITVEIAEKKGVIILIFNYSSFYHFSISLKIFLLDDRSTKCFETYYRKYLILHRYDDRSVHILFRWRIFER